MRSRQFKSLLAISASHGVMHAYLVILPALLPLIKEELGGYQVLGLLVSLLFLVYGWGSFPVGMLADRFSKKKLILASMMVSGISSLLIGFSPGCSFIAASLILLGLGTSLYHPTGFSLLSLLSQRARGRYMGIHGIGGNAGIAVGYLSSVSAGYFLGWRRAFFIWGMVGIIMGLIDLKLIEEGRGREKKIDQKISTRNYFQLIKQELWRGMNLKIFLLIFSIIICCGLLWNGVSAFLVAYINEVKKVELILAGGLATISYIVGSLGQITGGEASDRIGRRSLLLLGFGSFSLILFLFALPFRISPFSMIVFVSALGFSFFLTQSPLNALIGDISPRGARGFIYGANFMVKYGMGGISPAIAGYLIARYSMTSIFYFFALISVLAFALSLNPLKKVASEG